MKKILIIVLILILLTLAYVTIVKGLNIGSLEILSIVGIKNASEELDNKIYEADKLTTLTYNEKIDLLNSSVKELIKNKNKYQEIAAVSTNQQVSQATQHEKYDIEFLWTKIGNHATKLNIDIKMDITASSSGTPDVYDLKFITTGSYIAITDFIYALENDTTLAFKIEDFVILPDQGNVLKCTFNIKDISVNVETLEPNNANNGSIIEESTIINQQNEPSNP